MMMEFEAHKRAFTANDLGMITLHRGENTPLEVHTEILCAASHVVANFFSAESIPTGSFTLPTWVCSQVAIDAFLCAAYGNFLLACNCDNILDVLRLAKFFDGTSPLYAILDRGVAAVLCGGSCEGVNFALLAEIMVEIDSVQGAVGHKLPLAERECARAVASHRTVLPHGVLQLLAFPELDTLSTRGIIEVLFARHAIAGKAWHKKKSLCRLGRATQQPCAALFAFDDTIGFHL
jgi:hypothetical protein